MIFNDVDAFNFYDIKYLSKYILQGLERILALKLWKKLH